MAMAGRLKALLGLGPEMLRFLRPAEAILRLGRLLQGGKLRCDGD